MIPKKLRGFVEKLHESTEDEKIEWHEGGDRSYFCNHKDHTLYFSNRFDEDTEVSTFRFEIETSGKSTPFTVSEHEADYIQMKNLFEATIVNANNVDEDLDDFFD
ncbi:hypothetical protein [Pseudoalteromonas sp. bablab_jr010]|uniref:hypothetical protein n=1 Tax=Pseudoalteromonas sp. bablab_jr010 TaxID=2755063 RepID=UPI0018F7087E|nr:hypothetical protein [Pseudoalteromonas sp. bablab_jr010]